MTRINDEQILSALITGGSVRKAAKIAHISESTIRNRLKNDDFKAAYQAIKDDILIETCNEMTSTLSAAIDTLTEVMQDPDTISSVRVSAADSILRHGLRYNEAANILKRIEELEKIASK